MTSWRCIEIVLTIPDNEARTALATLQRLGVAAAGLERADLYRCEIEDGTATEGLADTLRTLEPVFNPNKHALRVREGDGPAPGEVWVEELLPWEPSPAAGSVRIAGRTLPGVRRLRRAVVWRLLDAGGRAAEHHLVERATELLCNSAFQKATLP